MSFGLFKHIYQYFVPPEEPDAARTPASQMLPARSVGGFIILYDAEGEVAGYIPDPKSNETKKPQLKAIMDLPRRNRQQILPMEEKAAPNVVRHAHNAEIIKPTPPANKLEWDSWPDGFFERDFTFHDVDDYNNLQVHWATKTHGHRGGSDSAESWDQGKKQHRECLGIIECDNPDCLIAIRPQTTAARIDKQLRERCKCGAVLNHTKCDVKSITWTYSKGVHFLNAGFHQHARPAHILHISKDERVQFEAIVNTHPTVGPLAMVVGVPGVKGPGESVADISDVFVNAGRVGKERLKIKKGGLVGGGDEFISAFAKFTKEYPGFVIFSQLGAVTVICVQSPLMRTEMVKERLLDGPVNGLVNDAAHGWWKERTSLLVMSSSYCPDLLCWVPGVISYANGASGEHFKCHFMAVLESIAHEAGLKGHPIVDKLFAGVMDFSEAERLGFTMAFIEFWTIRSDSRSTKELSEAAGRLLRGCQEHFRAAVTRVARINGAVPPDLKDAFTQRALGLLGCPTTDEFQHRAALIVRDFPKLKSWMEWWMRPAHASMLFQSERKMEIEIWDSIPKTTNAQESMHWKFYSMCGRDHSFLEGMYALWAVATYYQRLLNAVSKGTPIRYGAPEPWKVKAAAIGRTKPSRAPRPEEKKRKKNDGRPPDTVKELLLAPTKKLTVPKPPKPMIKELLTAPKLQVTAPKLLTAPIKPAPAPPGFQFGPASYPWKDNSCWLDASLEVLYVAIERDFPEFCDTFQSIDPDVGLGAFYSVIYDRLSLDLSQKDLSKILASQRDQLRLFLRKNKLITGIDQPESAVSWLPALTRIELEVSEYSRAAAYLMTSFLNVDYCTGSLEIGGPHVQISATPRHELFFQVPASKYTDFQGSIFNACKERFSGTKVFESPETTDSCWRVKDGEILCPGTRKEIHKLILSIPVIWGIEIGDESRLNLGAKRQYWDFPQTITPDLEEAALEFGIIYDLVGFVLVDFQGTHFIARYATDDGTKIYTYDSMRHNGYPVHVEEMTFDAHMSGKNPQLPDGFMIWAATYVLRGGLAAQDKFYRIRTKEYATRYNLGFSEVTLDKLPTMSYHRAGFQEMDKKGRKWLFNPHANKTTEYISTPIPSRPPAQDGPESEDEMVAPIASQVSLPDSDFALNCRCGATGDGNLVYHQQDGEVVQCDECRDWSHIACQRHGRASNLLPKDQFLCDDCDPKAIQDLLPTKRTSTRRLMKARTLMNKCLEDRLRPGRAGLVRCSSFWYPVRVIQREGPKTWRVRWWRGCQFVDGGMEPGSLASISMDDIVDSLWLKRAERRKIRLGKWTHPHNLPTSEDILSDPESIRYTDEVHKALEPHKGPLRRLLTSPNSLHPEVSHEAIPAKKWLADNGKPLEKTLIPHVGTLSVIERAQIANDCPCTYPLHRLSDGKGLHLRVGSTAILREIDVDKECLESLEEEMFERTERTGISGNWQWGLDVGHHQDGWDPSFGVPENWDEKKRMGSESEREFGPDYIHFKTPPPELDMNTQIRPRPKPQPINKGKKAGN